MLGLNSVGLNKNQRIPRTDAIDSPRVAAVRPFFIVAVVLAGCALTGLLSPAKSPPDRLPDLAPAAPTRAAVDPHTPFGVGKAPFEARPSTSCAAAACHGGGEVGKLGSEHSTWAPEAFPTGGMSDPHNKAYRVLFNEASVRMGKLLHLKEAPHKEAICLKCHAVETKAEPEIRDQILAEGVGCSACHGPADKWISVHYLPDWKALTPEKKWQEYGFVPTKNLVARTLNCAGCHVGDAEREVNHDLIAAGHPRLAFEAARFHYQPDYRKHWTERTPQPDFEIRAWVVGQAAALRTATDLLRVRAERAAANDPKAIWPEFEGYSCYACHQKVGEEALRGTTGITPRPAGVPGWEVWSNTTVRKAADYCGAAYPGLSSPNLTELKALRTLMESKRTPAPAVVAVQAKKAVAELDAWLVAMQAAEESGAKPVPKGTAQRLAHALAANALTKDQPLLADHDWDALAANYLGCAAMFHASGGSSANKWAPQLEKLRDSLRFPFAQDGRFNSPADLTHGKLDLLRMNFKDLRDATAPTGGN